MNVKVNLHKVKLHIQKYEKTSRVDINLSPFLELLRVNHEFFLEIFRFPTQKNKKTKQKVVKVIGVKVLVTNLH